MHKLVWIFGWSNICSKHVRLDEATSVQSMSGRHRQIFIRRFAHFGLQLRLSTGRTDGLIAQNVNCRVSNQCFTEHKKNFQLLYWIGNIMHGLDLINCIWQCLSFIEVQGCIFRTGSSIELQVHSWKRYQPHHYQCV